MWHTGARRIWSSVAALLLLTLVSLAPQGQAVAAKAHLGAFSSQPATDQPITPASAQDAIIWARGYPEVGPSGCVDYVAQWSDGTYTATPWDCGPGRAPRRGDLTGSRGYPQLAANGCIEYVTQWSDGSYTWVPFSCPTGVVYFKPGTPVPASAAERAVETAVARFERGHMVWRQDRSLIYVLYDEGQWTGYPDTFSPGDPEKLGLTPPPGLLEPIRGFGKVWRMQLGVAQRLGWQVAPEQGVQGTVVEAGGTTILDTRGLGRWVIRSNGTFDKVR